MMASLALQRALVDAWAQDPGLSQIGLKLFDGPPADARPPYVTIGPDSVTEQAWAGGGSREHRFRLNLWDARQGMAPGKALLADIVRVVLAMPRQIEGGRVVSIRLVRSQVKTDPKSWTHGILEFRAVTEMED